MGKIQCLYCGVEMLENNLYRHIKRKHPSEEEIEPSTKKRKLTTINCALCEEEISKKNYRHMRNKHLYAPTR